MYNFALTGLAGYVAPRHLKAIKETGNRLVVAADLHDSVGIIDSYFPEASFFTEVERFDRHLEKLRRESPDSKIDYLSICSPNHLHDAHIRLALRVDAHAICEKPLVIKPWNLDALQKLEEEYGKRVYTILQLRVHPDLIKLKQKLEREQKENGRKHKVRLTYIPSRGKWYRYSWKGDEEKSGGIATNIGIHFFDLLMWFFGSPRSVELHCREEERIGGFMDLPGAEVEWYLSLNDEDLPEEMPQGQRTWRSITVDGQEVEFNTGFNDLHTRVYEQTLAGKGFRIDDARPSIELVHRLRTMDPAARREGPVHPNVQALERTAAGR